jgi:hypothetical protein
MEKHSEYQQAHERMIGVALIRFFICAVACGVSERDRDSLGQVMVFAGAVAGAFRDGVDNRTHYPWARCRA